MLQDSAPVIVVVETGERAVTVLQKVAEGAEVVETDVAAQLGSVVQVEAGRAEGISG